MSYPEELLESATSLFQATPEHGRMLEASRRCVDVHKKSSEGSIEKYLFTVAHAFFQLQEKRHAADYDLSGLDQFLHASPIKRWNRNLRASLARCSETQANLRRAVSSAYYALALLFRRKAILSRETGASIIPLHAIAR
jgi:hypothetical protein